MSEQNFKITDKRMFTADGELRAEYQGLNQERLGEASPEPSPPRVEEPAAKPEPELEIPARPPLELPAADPAMGAPSFFDLVSVLAEPAAAYLGDAGPGAGGEPQDLETARAYIDLLDILRQRTLGQLTSQESAVLEDVIYRLKTRYVQKRG